jgi:xylulokinase
MANGYINYRLTGRAGMDKVRAALLKLRDCMSGAWSEEMCLACEADPSRSPSFSAAKSPGGDAGSGRGNGYPRRRARDGGTVGGAAAELGAGTVASGTAVEMTGTSTVLLIPNETSVAEPSLIAMPHTIQNAHLLLGAMSSSGACLGWFRKRFCSEEVAEVAKTGEDP